VTRREGGIGPGVGPPPPAVHIGLPFGSSPQTAATLTTTGWPGRITSRPNRTNGGRGSLPQFPDPCRIAAFANRASCRRAGDAALARRKPLGRPPVSSNNKESSRSSRAPTTRTRGARASRPTSRVGPYVDQRPDRHVRTPRCADDHHTPRARRPYVPRRTLRDHGEDPQPRGTCAAPSTSSHPIAPAADRESCTFIPEKRTIRSGSVARDRQTALPAGKPNLGDVARDQPTSPRQSGL